MSDKTFKVGERFSAVAFRSCDGFVNLKIGYWTSIAADMHLTPTEAIELSRALADAASFAGYTPPGPRIGTPADLGCEVL